MGRNTRAAEGTGLGEMKVGRARISGLRCPLTILSSISRNAALESGPHRPNRTLPRFRPRDDVVPLEDVRRQRLRDDVGNGVALDAHVVLAEPGSRRGDALRHRDRSIDRSIDRKQVGRQED